MFLGVIFLLIFVIVLPFLIRDNFANIQKLGITLKYHEILSYLITALSVIVTAILSCITVFISKKASMVSDRMLSIEEEKLSPYLDIVREKSFVYNNRTKERKVYCEGQIFNSVKEACKFYGFSSHNAMDYRCKSEKWKDFYYID